MRYTILTILLMICFSFAQVIDMDDLDRLQLKWEIEQDTSVVVDSCVVYRSENNGDFIRFGIVDYVKDTTQVFVNEDLIPGILYSYYIIAFSTLGKQSFPSDTVSEAIPITYPMSNYEVYSGETFPLVGLSPYAYDLDGDELRWLAFDPDTMTVTVTGTNALVTYPTGFIGSDTVTFIVEQTDSLRDFFNFTTAVFTVKERPTPKIKVIWIESTRH